ncbi:MAG: hypothetical protein WB646_02010, partial [Steroidobacteraceae bacterium]
AHISITFHNTGHLPARYVTPKFRTHTRSARPSNGDVVAKDQSAACEDAIANPQKGMDSRAVFPGQKVQFDTIEDIGASEFPGNLEQIIYVYGCIVYQTGMDPPLGSTGVALQIDRKSTDHPPAVALPYDVTSVPLEELRISDVQEQGLWPAN